jgi:PAS domain S-box-containing protein
MKRTSWFADGARMILLAGIYFAVARLSLAKFATLHESASPVWAPTGLAIAALLLGRARLWPGIFAGAFLANLFTKGSPITSLGIAAGNALEALAGSWLVRKFANGRDAFERPRDVVAFTVLAGLVATAVSATLGVGSLTLGGYAERTKFWPIWTTWWLGDAGGALLVAPVVLLWGDRPRPAWSRRQWLEIAALLVALIAAAELAFGGLLEGVMRKPPVSFLPLPILVWAALRFGPRETASASLVLSAGAIWGTAAGHGSLARDDTNEALLLLQVFLGVLSIMALLLASAVRERERARGGLRESEERIRLVLDTALDGVVTMDATGVIRDWNPQAERIFGWARDEAVGRLMSETIIPESNRKAHAQGLSRFQATGEGRVLNRRMEMTALHRDGREFPVELAIVPVRSGGTTFFSGFIRDITERKRADALLANHVSEIERLNATLQEQKAELSTYHGLVTHDVSNFCATLQGIVERLLLEADGPLGGKQVELIRRANRQSFEMNRLVENAKLLSRLREKGLPPQAERVSVQGALQRVIDLVRSVHFDRPFRVEMEGPEGLSVAGVPFVENIFLNIIDNAVRHSSRDQSPVIRIRSGAQDGHVEVTIRGGTAVEGDLLARVFDRYVRGPHSTGTGLGLALIREIVERSGGKVEARNAEEGDEPVFEIALQLPKG